MHKLREALGPDTAGDERSIGAAASGRPAAHLETLRRAAAERERVAIEYFAGSTGTWSTRDIEPEEVFSAMGNWYVAAWDVAADDERLFRADRIKAVRATGIGFEAAWPARSRARPVHTHRRGGARAALARPRGALDRGVLRDRRSASNGTTARSTSRFLQLELAWVTRLLLRAGPEARATSPDEVHAAVVDLARATLRRYR